MLNSTQSLGVNNSSEQAGMAHQTSLYTQLFVEDVLRTAIKLESQIQKLYEVRFVQDLFLDEWVESDHHVSQIINTVSQIAGHSYVERIREEETV